MNQLINMNKKHKQPTKGEILNLMKQNNIEQDLKVSLIQANMRSKLLSKIKGSKVPESLDQRVVLIHYNINNLTPSKPKL